MRADEFVTEYEITVGVAPSGKTEDSIDKSKFFEKELGDVNGYRVVLYRDRLTYITGYTFVTDKESGETVGYIGHNMPTSHSRLALSVITKKPGTPFHMDSVCMLLIANGFTLESDSSNTLTGAHAMLMRLAKRTKTHIEDGEGNVIPHTGDITSPENVALYTTSKHDENFLDDNKHKYVIVFTK